MAAIFKMKVVIIGKNGQLGQELTALFTSQKNDVLSYGREELDITDKKNTANVIKKIKPDLVINASAFHQVAECEEFPEKAFEINAVAVKNIAEASASINAVFVHYSTDYVFDGKKGESYKEDEIPNPLQIYGISKYAGEIVSLNYNPSSIIIRTCGVFGGKTGSRSKKGNFILTILKQIEGKKELEVSSEQIVSPTYAHDLAKYTLKLLEKKPKSGIYHLINEGYCSWAEFAQEIAKLVNSKTKIIPVDRRGESGGARRPLFSALSNTKAKKMGVVLPDWRDGLSRYIVFLSLT